MSMRILALWRRPSGFVMPPSDTVRMATDPNSAAGLTSRTTLIPAPTQLD
jgi:hypothetical protein